MTMRSSDAPPPHLMGGGADALRVDVFAVTCGDEGAALVCGKCGHEFLTSDPFTDQSHPKQNTQLARELFYHMCALGRRDEHKAEYATRRR